ncbi:uncharacterized protein LOC132742415 isoform X2 [Ruditapes philippinarum]|uniref:uncharacterized protein LOC132742415 isoform X2 n=1 Tax=Ruditapes philippinarum TaxID=129788 RepID=UPI00295AF471|nr:uncharacterized protein LOC132742415 isoform X2 [Ruditapes philippinarum]
MMIEKWMLVLLIVGCTSLVFLICFPIDFYLYRRRRRLARERKNLTMYRPQTQSNRAAQIHAKVTVAEVAAEIDFEEMNKKDRKVYRAQRGIMRFLSLIRKKDKQTLNHSKDFKSENSSECRVLTTPETSNTMAHSENKNHLDHSTSTRSQDFGEISRGEKDYVEINVPNSWKKSMELVSQDSKQFNYGENEPQINSSSTAYNPAESRSHIIPVKSRGTINFKPERSNMTSRDHTGSNRDIIVESKAEYGQSEVTKGENIQSEDSGFYTHLSVEDTNREMYTPIQEFRDSDNETEFQHQENLVHSNSDQNISFTPKSAKVSFKSRKKGNVISPTNKLTSSLSEQFCIEEKENSTLSKARTLSLSTTFEEPSARSSKWTKKKESILKKQSSDSMPELQRYQKEKF